MLRISEALGQELSARVYRFDGTPEWCSTQGDEAVWASRFERAAETLAQQPAWASDEAIGHRLIDPSAPTAVRVLLLAPRRQQRPSWLQGVSLTPRQREVAELASYGATTDEIASHLGISPNTVRTHLKAVYRDLGVANRVELAATLRYVV